MAKQVAMFCITIPNLLGITPEGTSCPVSICISCFSPPVGYLVGKTQTLIFGLSAVACCNTFIASGLLSSMPIRI